jgi:acyl-CoA thioester hydrolase
MNQLEKFNKNYPVNIELKVQWGDMDAFNHVNNVMYFRYFESARLAYFERIGVMDKSNNNQIAPILAETSCRYRLPLNYPDTILVGARVIENHSHGFLMEYAIFSQSHKAVSSIGTGRIVMLNYKTHEKVPVKPETLEAIKSLSIN